MAIFTGSKTKPLHGPRKLTIRHRRKVTAVRKKRERAAGFTTAVSAVDESDDDSDTDIINPGEEKLNSFWAPALAAGPRHRVKVTQNIHNGIDNDLVLDAEQDFYVDAPQFSLPEGSIHSIYPPAGYSDDHRILPHVVLTDPHLPWERYGSLHTGNVKTDRNRVPWIVVFSFSQDELRLPTEALNGPSSMFTGTSDGLVKPVKQISTMAINMSVADLWRTAGITTPVVDDGREKMAESRGDFIFVKPDLFTSLFSTFDAHGNRVVPQSPNTSQFKYLSHVRKINPEGMAVAGGSDRAIFSVVIGNRAGPLDNITPTTMAVHLVSIEDVEALRFPISTNYVALCSLYSWNYTVMPPGMLNVREAFDHLGETLSVLRVPDEVIEPLKSGSKTAVRVADRLRDGYSLVKYRTQTGEPTVGLFRGPFTPTVVRKLDGSKASNSGIDLQILDKEVGIMDLTYSVAWQTGRTLALGDESFTAALGRLRTAVHNEAAKKAKIETLRDIDPLAYRSRSNCLRDMGPMLQSLATIHDDTPAPPFDGNDASEPAAFAPGGAKRRWSRRRLRNREIPDLSFMSPEMEHRYPRAAQKAALNLAASTDGAVYDETNDPLSTDWMMVLGWLLDRMFLEGVPAHCLITDPSHLQPERLRFFYIDPNWIDAMIDGALSLGNHMGEDRDRVAIKEALNTYITTTPAGMDHPPQIPSYGFYLRSDLVTMFPDLRVATLPVETPLASLSHSDTFTGAPLLRHEIVADGVMMALLDRVPGSDKFTGLEFTQPPHQQRFAAAGVLEQNTIKVDIRRQYTVSQDIRKDDPLRLDALLTVTRSPADGDNLFIWGSAPGLEDLRILRLPHFAEFQRDTLAAEMGTYDNAGHPEPYFEDDTATSALFAMQLNDPIYRLTISFHTPTAVQALASLSMPPDEAQLPRTVQRLQSPRVKHTKRAEQHLSSDSDLDNSDGDGGATFRRHRSYKPPMHTLMSLGPHIRAIPTLEEVAGEPTESAVPAPHLFLALAATGPRDQAATAPQIDCLIRSHGANAIKVGNDTPQDVIFGVSVTQNKETQFRLVELDFRIRLGSAQATNENFLMENYTGPGPNMLSNLRFNVLPAIVNVSGTSYLQLRVLPRSSKGWIDVATVSDMSFVLNLVNVNLMPRRLSQMFVDIMAYYYKDTASPRLSQALVTVINTSIA